MQALTYRGGCTVRGKQDQGRHRALHQIVLCVYMYTRMLFDIHIIHIYMCVIDFMIYATTYIENKTRGGTELCTRLSCVCVYIDRRKTTPRGALRVGLLFGGNKFRERGFWKPLPRGVVSCDQYIHVSYLIYTLYICICVL